MNKKWIEHLKQQQQKKFSRKYKKQRTKVISGDGLGKWWDVKGAWLKAADGTEVAPDSNGYHRTRDGVLHHRKVYHDNCGGIPQGWVVHHIDGVKTNNHIDNLIALPNRFHSKLHGKTDSKHSKAELLVMLEDHCNRVQKIVSDGNRRKLQIESEYGAVIKEYNQVKSQIAACFSDLEEADTGFHHFAQIRASIAKQIQKNPNQVNDDEIHDTLHSPSFRAMASKNIGLSVKLKPPSIPTT